METVFQGCSVSTSDLSSVCTHRGTAALFLFRGLLQLILHPLATYIRRALVIFRYNSAVFLLSLPQIPTILFIIFWKIFLDSETLNGHGDILSPLHICILHCNSAPLTVIVDTTALDGMNRGVLCLLIACRPPGRTPIHVVLLCSDASTGVDLRHAARRL